MRAIVRVGQAVNIAVERFVAVGEAIADDNPEIKVEMYDACKDARAAGNYHLCEAFICFLFLRFFTDVNNENHAV